MSSYILCAIFSILIWNVSVFILEFVGIPFYFFNPSLIIIPIIVFSKVYKNFKQIINIKKFFIGFWCNYLILLFYTYVIYYFLYTKDFCQEIIIHISFIVSYYFFLVLQNIVFLHISKLRKKVGLYPYLIMIFSFLISLIITLAKFQIFYGSYNQIFIWFDYSELLKEGFFVEYVIIYQLTLFYFIAKKTS